MALGETIQRLREAKRLTQGELARKAKVTRPYITMLETGVKKNPSLAILQRLAKALGVPTSRLLKVHGTDRRRGGGEVRQAPGGAR